MSEVLLWVVSFVIFGLILLMAGQVVTWCMATWHQWRVQQIERERMVLDTRRVRRDLDLTTISEHNLVVPRAELLSGVLTQQIAATLFAKIQTQLPVANVPQTITYSPHNSYRHAPEVETALTSPPALPVQDFWQLFTGGQLPQQGFLLGHSLEDGEPINADWRNLYSALIGGQSGSGKSTLIRGILAQSALQGGRFVVLDKHAGAGDESLADSLTPLRRLMLVEPASTDRQMMDALRYVSDVGHQRLAGMDKDKSPVILVVDETTALLQRSDVADYLTQVLGEISQETRKVGVYALCIGQIFTADVMRSTVRNAFVSFLSCRARRDVARVMSGNNLFGQAAEQLTTGQAVWQTPGGEVHRLAVPNATAQHLALVAQSLALSPHEYGEKIGATHFPHEEVGTSNPTSNPLPEARDALVRNMLRMQASQNEIIKAGWGAEGGRAYQEASTQLREMIARMVA